VTLELTEGSTNIHQLVWIYFFRQTFFFSFFDKRRIIKVKLIKSHKYTLVNKELKDIFRGNNHFVKNHFIKNHKITLRNLRRLNLPVWCFTYGVQKPKACGLEVLGYETKEWGEVRIWSAMSIFAIISI